MTPVQPSSASQRRHARAHALIPGGAHTYAKGDDQFPERYPQFLVRGKGAHVWDVDGNRYIEYGSGLRAVTLGHAFPPVVQAAANALAQGTNFVRPAALEVDVAERLLAYVKRPGWMVKFGKNGSDCTTAAVRLARAHTGRDLVAVCRDHPFFSIDDWFIATTPMNAGVPAAVARLTLSFAEGDHDELEQLFARHGQQLAAVVLEAARYQPPAPGFLEAVQAHCRRHGTVLILDEMITGFRWRTGTAMGCYGLEPDLVAFGKALGNGLAVSALVGRPELLARGGLRAAGPRVFLLSLTHGAETASLAGAGAVIDTYADEPVIEVLHRQGSALAAGLATVAAGRGVADHFRVVGLPANLAFVVTDAESRPSQAYRTLLLQELAARGVLAPSLVIGYQHDDAVVARTLEAFDGALAVHARALEEGTQRLLVGAPSRPVFRRDA